MKAIRALVLLALTIAIYGLTVKFGFLSWDDDVNITGNTMVTGAHFASIWSGFYYGMYIPMSLSAWAALAGLTASPSPILFHLANMTLHLLNTVLVYVLLARLMPSKRGGLFNPAFLGAILFCCHPLQVETVAWASGLRDLLSATFGLLALLVYMRSKSAGKLAVAFLLFVFALLSKPSALALAPAALLIGVWQNPAQWKHTALRLSPWFLAAILVPILTAQAQKNLGGEAGVALWFRPLIATDALGFYVQKLILPVHLAVDYGRTPIRVMSERLWIPTLFTMVATLPIWFTRYRVYFGLFVILLLPVLGLVPFAYQYTSTVADHYVYLAMFGAAGLLASFVENARSRVPAVIVLAAMIVFAAAARTRTAVWSEDHVFYSDMLETNPNSFQANIGLGDEARRVGQFMPASEFYLRALKIAPASGLAQLGLAFSLTQSGHNEEAVRFLEPLLKDPAQLKINSDSVTYYANLYYFLGRAHAGLGQWTEAAGSYCEAMKLSPGNPALTSSCQDASTRAGKPASSF